MIDRRRNTRIDNMNLIDKVKIEGSIMIWKVVDISINGLRLQTKQKGQRYDAGERIRIRIDFKSGKSTHMKAIVTRVDINSSAYEMGIEFE